MDLSDVKIQVGGNGRNILPGGFTSDDQNETMVCFSCNIKVKIDYKDMSEETLYNMHINLSPFCPKIKDSPQLKKMKSLNKSKGNTDAVPTPQVQNIPNQPAPIEDAIFNPPDQHPEFSDEQRRSQSFDELHDSVIPVDQFVAAGFYRNNPPHDRVTCFCCDGSLERWCQNEHPLTEHAKYYPGCAFLRRLIGTNKIYRIRSEMSATEIDAASNLRYTMNKNMLYQYYQAYNKINVRVRSLVAGGFPLPNARLLAVQGFHWDDESNLIQCYYCGLYMGMTSNQDAVKDVHTALSDQCERVKAGVGASPNAGLDNDEVYLVCIPCGCLVQSSEQSSDSFSCPGCEIEITSFKPLTNHNSF